MIVDVRKFSKRSSPSWGITAIVALYGLSAFFPEGPAEGRRSVSAKAADLQTCRACGDGREQGDSFGP